VNTFQPLNADQRHRVLCASDNDRLEISSKFIAEGGSLSGSWGETTRGVSGTVSGRTSGAEILPAGSGFTARLDVSTHGDSQSVTIRLQGADVAAVSIVLRKG
jgi:hypothetical protein